ncbi:hypothetical protein HK107_14480 [Parvularcula sp. ZS-1/3]|uniref:Uncharacterized protein n=1 Tax=Parvularcula mediterranea TaxID=2732508 RepID=A0A7Y3RPP6_9PROT|nr:hypothetical protein [Parvularcula mediterranea]NNU17535.1 hypothetical protein [Parvularcula mediterranea]
MTGTIETTEAGEQRLISGVRPVGLRDRLKVRASEPLRPKRHPDCQQRPCDIGLFDSVGRAQIDLIDLVQAEGRAKPEP